LKINRPSGQTALDILGKDKETVIRELNSQYDFVGEIRVNELVQLEIERIVVEEQIREEFDESKINNLADSIRDKGILQPLIVRQETEKYILVAGERRLKASKIAGLNKVPCVVMDIKKEDVPLLQLFENIQRENLSELELNKVFQGMKEKGLTIEEIAQKVHQDKSYIHRYLSISKFSDEEKKKLEEGVALTKLTEARKIKNEEKKKEVLDNINNLSRKEIEKIKNKSSSSTPSKSFKGKGQKEISHGEKNLKVQNVNENLDEKTQNAAAENQEPKDRKPENQEPENIGMGHADQDPEAGGIKKIEFNETKEDRLELKELVEKFNNINSMRVLYRNGDFGDEITIKAGTKTLIDILYGLKKKFNLI